MDIRNIQIIPEDNEIMAVDDLGKSYFYFDLNNGQFLRKETSLIGSMVACKYNHLYFSSIVNGMILTTGKHGGWLPLIAQS